MWKVKTVPYRRSQKRAFAPSRPITSGSPPLSSCAELDCTNGTVIEIDVDAVKSEYVEDIDQHSESDRMFCNDSLTYSDLVLKSDMAGYPKRILIPLDEQR